ncbi:MAG: fumarylacetoacetate hydrolase family protein [Alphaproteobacteria bacterium]|jgi:2-keto-4-pentenoate hydratase/2-oxohepta-3-ene-1,7-dioic acid hydratase in catechol pathway|nr:fumarylacetoacetate hydrolase family protein [Alphaproteobacteria bacterium]
MKLMHFNDFRLGVLTDAGVVDVTDLIADIPHTNPGDRMSGLIARFDDYRGKLEAAAAAGPAIPVGDVRIRPPTPRPGNIACMAVNYMENGTLPAPPPPNAFHKAANAIIGNGDIMVLPDAPATIFEGEAELALVIGKRACKVPADKAFEHIFGYMNFIDGSARGLPPERNVFFQAKSRDTFAPIGPYLVTADEVADPQNLDVKLWVNGDCKQDFNTSDMAHKIPKIIEWVSAIHTLEPGDIVATGTNHRGLSSFQDGDTVELEVQDMGRLTISVQDDLKRTWSRETRLDRKENGHDTPTPQLTGKYAK